MFLLTLVKHLTLSHAKLLQKLNTYKIRNVEFEWFLNYLFNHKQLGNFNNILSESGLLAWGILQGSILGLLLFIIFENDIVDVLRNARIIKYADDTVLYIASNNI